MRLDLVLIGAAALCGLAWGHDGAPWLMGLAVVVPLLWHRAGNRWTAGAVVLAYYLATSRGMPFGFGIFFEASAPTWYGWALWVACGLANAALWCALWSRDAGRRIWLMPAILVLTAVPPIGIIGWTSPLNAAGIFYPGMGFIGLAFLVGLMAASMRGRWPAVAMFAGAALVANASAAFWPKNAPAWATAWAGQDTHFPRLQTANLDIFGEGQRVMQVLHLAGQVKPGHVLVLPETVLPQLSAANTFTASMLDDAANVLARKRSTIVVGAELHTPGQRLKNALVVLGAGQRVELVQRIPVPIGMWKPWRNDTFAVDLLGSGVAQVAGRRVAYSVCYEQLLVWPMMASMLQSPEVIVGAANGWWARNTSIPAIQGQSLDAWGRLFAVPVVRAANL